MASSSLPWLGGSAGARIVRQPGMRRPATCAGSQARQAMHVRQARQATQARQAKQAGRPNRPGRQSRLAGCLTGLAGLRKSSERWQASGGMGSGLDSGPGNSPLCWVRDPAFGSTCQVLGQGRAVTGAPDDLAMYPPRALLRPSAKYFLCPTPRAQTFQRKLDFATCIK